MSGHKILTFLKEYSIVTIGILLYVVGWITFLLPNNMVGGGVSGISSIIQYATGGAIKMGYSYFVINMVLVISAVIILGKGMGAKTIYAIILASVGLNVLQELMYGNEEVFAVIQALGENGKFICTVMGGVFSGIGIGMSMSVGGSTGGTDIIALIVNKYRNISPGRMLLAIDVVIICSSLLVPTEATGTAHILADKITRVIYGLILVVSCSYVVDLYLSGAKRSVQILVFSKNPEVLADGMINQMRRGVTVLDGTGWYSKKDQKVVLVVARRTDLNSILKYVKSVDPSAFVSVAGVNGVYGQGFDQIKR